MSHDEHLHAHWNIWRHERVTALTHPYGWSSPIAQHWLQEGTSNVSLPDLPGLWSAGNGKLTYTASEQEVVDPPPLTLDGTALTGATVIESGRFSQSGHAEAKLILSGEREIETIVRSTPTGGNLYAVRVRDPRSAATAETLPIDAFDYVRAWRVSATFTPHVPTDLVRETLAEGVVDHVQSVGTVTFSDPNGKQHELVVFGNESRAFTHFRDATSGAETHGNGRVLEVPVTDITRVETLTLDFNFSYCLPCALTTYVSCPVPIAENRLDVAVTAGERNR